MFEHPEGDGPSRGGSVFESVFERREKLAYHLTGSPTANLPHTQIYLEPRLPYATVRLPVCRATIASYRKNNGAEPKEEKK